MQNARIFRTWSVLMGLTALTYALGEFGAFSQASVVPVMAVLAFSGIKAVLVILDFLEMRDAPALWRWLLLGWLAVVLGLISIAYWIAF